MCKIFGHVCPVFFVCEPLTETKELRNISRNIPRPTQFRVLKRDNQICRDCGKAVQDEDIEFDHLIPWSKGGSSEESNIRLLCRECNRKRSNNFEDEYLSRSLRDHTMKQTGFEILEGLFNFVEFYHEFKRDHGREPKTQDFILLVDDNDELFASKIYDIVKDICTIFSSEPVPIEEKYCDPLKDRWGFLDGSLYTLEGVSETYNIDINKLVVEEKYFIQMLGWNIPLTESNKKKWMST